MSILDTPDQASANTPVWNTVLRYGLYCAGAYVALSILIYLVNFNMMSMGGLAVYYASLLVIGFVFAAMAIRYQRDQLDGRYITYGKALLVALGTVFIGVLISSLWGYVLVNFIDPNYVATMKEQFVAAWGDKMPAESLDEALEGFDKVGDIGALLKNGLIGGLMYGLIVGLIIAAFMKRQPEVKLR